jgi:hypothetical protein
MHMKRRLNTVLSIAVAVLISLGIAPGANAQTAGLVTDGTTITVGRGGAPRYLSAGYCTAAWSACLGSFGSMTQATSPEGFTIIAFADHPGTIKAGEVYQRTGLAIAGYASDPGQGWLSRASCGDVTYQGAAASGYSYSNGVASWTWSRPSGAQPAFQGRTSVTCAIHRSGTSGWVRPKYQVVGLTYAPPGSRSTANYTNGFMNGTSTKHTASFTSDTKVTVQVTTGGGLFGIVGGTQTQTYSEGWNQQKDSNTSLTISQQTSNGLIVPGPASSAAGVDHDYDTIYVWLNPEIFMMVFPTAVTVGGYGYDVRDPVTGMDVIPLTVGQLRGVQPITPNAWARLNRTWDSQTGGLTSVDFQTILQANPFAVNPAYNPNTDPTRRYELPLSGNPPLPANLILNYVPAPPGGQPTGQTYNSSYSNTSEVGKSAKHSYSVTHSVDNAGSVDFFIKFDLKLTAANTLTYANQWSSAVTAGTSQSANFTIYPPFAADNYVGPTAIQVWKDNVYGTFMFYPQN